MKRLLSLALSLILPLATPAAGAVKASEVIGNAIDGFVRPGYAALSARADTEAAAMKTLCLAPSAAALGEARSGFSALVDAWSAVETVQFGPISRDNRLERMLFWPDRKGLGLRQVQAAIAARDPVAADPARIASKSVAMQGLGALEFVLYGTGADTLAARNGAYRCSYGMAVAENVATIARDVKAEWDEPDGFAAQWASPGPGNRLYRDGNEAVTDLMGVFINGLDLIRDVRLKGFLGTSPDDDTPKQAIYWRSAMTADSLAANLEGMNRLFTVSRLGDALPPDARWMADSTRIMLANGAADARAASGAIASVLADPARRAKLVHFRLVTSTLSSLVGTRMSAAFGLTAGFSSLDGD